MKKKPCPYYEDIPVKSCNAVMEGIKVPTKREIDKFCLGSYEECSLYVNRETNIEREKEVMGIKKLKNK